MKRYRELFKLSQMALAEKVGCSPTLIGNIEILKRFPSPTNLNKIAEALKVHPSELFAEESYAIRQMESTQDVRERLTENLLKAIDSSLYPPDDT